MGSELNDKYIDGNIPLDGFLYAQQLLDWFVDINYKTASDVSYGTDIDAGHYKTQIIDVIRNNPPLASVPRYFNDGRENYLWYSDFYDDAGKEIFRQYGNFVAPAVKITPANYAIELAKIDLPYFKELVNLISLEKLYQEAEHKFATAVNKVAQPEVSETDIIAEQPKSVPTAEKPKKKQLPSKLSYHSVLNDKQYQLLEECANEINLFRRPIDASELKNLFAGKLSEPLQATNQKSLTYLLDQLVEAKYIKPTWITIAEKNKDFISFLRGKNAERYGDGPHYITWQQFSNCRNRNKKEYVEGYPTIDDAIENMQEFDK